MAQALELRFNTNTDQARNAIAQLASTVTSNMVQIGSAMKSANDNQDKLKEGLSALPSVLGRVAVAFVAFEAAKFAFHAVSNAIDEAKEKLKELVDIGQSAKTAGVGTDFFQAWTSHAAELNTTAEKLAGTLEHARAASEVTLGRGGQPNQSPFQATLGQNLAVGNISQADVNAYNSAKTLEDKFKVVLDLVEKLNGQGKQLAALDISQGFFGSDFTNRLRQGTTAVTKMREDLAGITKTKWPPELIERATQLNEEIEKAKNALSTGLAPIQKDIANGQLNWLVYTRDWYNFLIKVEGTLTSLYNWVKDIGNRFDEISHSATFEEFRKLGDFLDRAQRFVGHAGAELGYKIGLRGLPGEDQSDAYQLDQADQEAGARVLTIRGPGGKGDKSKGYAGRGSAGSDTDEVDTYIKSLQKSVEVLEAENRTFGQSNTEKAEAVDLEKALAAARARGTPLTDAERESVKRLADQEGAAKDKAEQLQRAQAAANEQAQLLGNSLISALDKIGESGAKATDVLKEMVKTLIKAVEQALLLGSGPFANLFGTQGASGNTGGLAGLAISGFGRAFGGGGGGGGGTYGAADYAAAEAAAAPGQYGPAFSGGGMVGRDGSPMFIPYSALVSAKRFDSGGGVGAIVHPGEVILNAAQQRNVAGSMGGVTQHINYNPVVNGSGLDAKQLGAVLNAHGEQLVRKIQRNIGPMVGDWQKRYG